MSTEHGQSTENGARSTESTDVGPVRAPMTQAQTRSRERMREIARAREEAKRARRASAETRTIAQDAPVIVAAPTTPPPSTSPVPEPAGPVAEPATSPVSTEPEKPRDPVALWQVEPVLMPDPIHPKMTTEPAPVRRKGGRLFVFWEPSGKLREIHEREPGTYVANVGGVKHVYLDREPVGWVRVPHASGPFEPGLSTSDSNGLDDKGRPLHPTRSEQSSAMLRGWESAQSRANREFLRKMDTL